MRCMSVPFILILHTSTLMISKLFKFLIYYPWHKCDHRNINVEEWNFFPTITNIHHVWCQSKKFRIFYASFPCSFSSPSPSYLLLPYSSPPSSSFSLLFYMFILHIFLFNQNLCQSCEIQYDVSIRSSCSTWKSKIFISC